MTSRIAVAFSLALAGAFGTLGTARADIVSEWADRTTEIATDGPNTVRTMALAQSAVYEAVNAITGRYPKDVVALGKTDDASIDAAVAAASGVAANRLPAEPSPISQDDRNAKRCGAKTRPNM